MDQKILLRLLSPALLPSAYLLTTSLSAALPAQSQILVHATSWAFIALYFAYQTGFRTAWSDLRAVRAGSAAPWTAGALLAASCVLGSVPLDDESVRWTRALLPLAVQLLRRAGLGSSAGYSSLDPEKPAADSSANRASLLAVLVVAAATVLAPAHSRPEAVALGVCGTVALALALVLLEPVVASDGHESDSAVWSPWAERDDARESKISLRNFATAVSLSCFIVSTLLGESLTGSMATRPSLSTLFGGQFKPSDMLFVHQSSTAVTAIALAACCGMLLLAMVCIRSLLE
jgi:hypothetical protein